jgi:hypothetical protein
MPPTEFGQFAKCAGESLGSESICPVIRDGCEFGIQLVTEIFDQRRQRIAEILILSLSEAELGHVDAAAKQLLRLVHRDQIRAFLLREQRGQQGKSAFGQ